MLNQDADPDRSLQAPAEQDPANEMERSKQSEDAPQKPKSKRKNNLLIFGPGQSDDGRPKLLHVDWAKLKDILERNSTERLNSEFGGVQGFAAELQSDLKTGVSSASVDARIAQFGENIMTKKEPATFLGFLWEAFQDQIVIILCVAAVVSIVFGMTLSNPHSGHVERETGWIEGTALIISVLIVTLVGSINNYQKAKQFEAMEKEQDIRELQVIRDGKEMTVLSNLLVVGDLLHIELGMEVPCDGLFVNGFDLKLNESALTGEPDLMEKDSDHVFVTSGTLVEEGNGWIIVIATGMGTVKGNLKATLDGKPKKAKKDSEASANDHEKKEGADEDGDDVDDDDDDDDDDETPLQKHLGELADNIGKFGLLGAAILLVALSIKEGILISRNERDANATSFLNFFLIAVTLIAVAIPEGLPLAVTISLAFSMKAMMKDNCMVRVLASCETMGAATALCSDKTGTLTTNQMTVVQGMAFEHEFLISGYELQPRHDQVEHCRKLGDGSAAEVSAPQMDAACLDRFCFALAINSTAHEGIINDQPVWIGNKTEAGMLKWVKAVKRNYEEFRASVPLDSKRQYPFSSTKKRMTTVTRDQGDAATIYAKGASETILKDCDRYVDAAGKVVPLEADRREEFEAIISDMANQGNRTIGFAFAHCDLPEFPAEEPSVPLIFMGVLGIQDPLRSAVPQAVLDAESAGVTTRMITGDNINTAIAIAKKAHIYRDNGFDFALTGEDFRRMLEEDRKALVNLLPRIKVLARSSPTDKHILVGLLQDEYGEVVGVTGDGTNDAPALKLGDVGFAMRTGTDIARDASDMVLLDDNFATVVTAIKWGRAVNDNIKKFLQFQLSINCAGVALTLVGSLASQTSKEPFTPVQLLWLNLIMDTLAAIALATELPEDACLARPPVFKQAPLVTNRMRLFIGIHGLFQFTVILLILFLGHDWFHTYEDEEHCSQGPFPDVPRLTTVGTSVIQNGTMPHPLSGYCRDICENEGGVYRGDGTCQQGSVHSTMIFNTFIWFQIFNVINARKIYGEFNPIEGVWSRSRNLLIVFGIIFALQVIAVELFGKFMSTTPLRWDYWLITVGLGSIELLVGVIQRLIPIQDHVPDFVERKAARLAEMREACVQNHALARKDSVVRRSSMPATKASLRRHSNTGGGSLHPVEKSHNGPE